MKVTSQLKGWLQEHHGLSAEASDEDVRKAAATAIFCEEKPLTPELQISLTTSESGKAVHTITAGFDQINQRLTAIESNGGMVSSSSTDTPEVKVADSAPKMPKDKDKADEASVFEAKFAGSDGPIPVEPGAPLVRVRGAHETYDAKRAPLFYPGEDNRGRKHPMAGQRVSEGGTRGHRYLHSPSQLDEAISGAYIKWSIECSAAGRSIPKPLRMTDHDRDLIQYALREERWGGVIGGDGSEGDGAMGVKDQRLSERQIKAVLDDATSGGLEVAPILFDDAIIQTPLLNGEFAPMVNMVNITRGRRVEGASIGNVTLGSETEGTAVSLFNTASFIAAFDTTIFVVAGAIELGLDFLSDSPVDVAGIVTRQYAQQLLTWLDTQIVEGDGTTEPEGVKNASGTVSVSSAGGAGAAPQVGDYENLLFGVTKNFRAGFPSNRIGYGATETTYARARGVAVGGTDARRVFGMTHEDYMVFGHPYGINEALANADILFGVWPRYRMYRRLGITVRTTTEGKELTLGNLMLISARARYGGQVEDGNAFAVIADAQA